ncbi:TIGR03086 family metal-binding protein [Streptomyces sp. NPDC093085]|uniref:TIGR03086 family metal-binding protein n=1 Tax=Streptomyces sp. NPDC093085 TaxID=3155068 RepID=UPI0034367978
MTSVTDFATVAREVQRLVESFDEQEWSLPTPCDEWDVRAVVDHLLDVQGRFRVTMTGGEKPATSTFEDNTTALIAAFGQEGALERTVTTRLGHLPGRTALDILTMEHLIHGWDLGRATGRTPSVGDSVVERVIAFCEIMKPRLPPHLRNFKDAQPVTEGASALDRLAALSGRTVTV